MKKFYFAYRSFWPEAEAHRRFNSIGVDTVCFFAANTTNSLGEPYCKYPPNWLFKDYAPEGQYDFDPVDAQLANLMRASPDANFICMIDLNTPLWLSHYWLLACDSFSQLGRLCSDPVWRRATAEYMRNLLAHMEEHYSGRIVAYVLSGGSTSEWYDNSRLAESESRSAAWNKELESLGLPPADVPGRLARNHVSFDNLLRDPQVDGDALRYIRFCADQVVDTIKFFLKEARKVTRPEAGLGVFYGYPLILEGERVIQGNNNCSELLKCPELDFIISPNGGLSAIGQGGGDLGPTESVQLAGKSYLRECDQKTHTFNRRLSEHVSLPWDSTWKTEAETIAGIKRELSYTLIKQCSVWWFDMWGGFYDPPVIMDLLENAGKIYRQHIETPVEKAAETVLIVDPESIYYLNQNDHVRTGWFYRQVKQTLDLLGAPYECYNFNDLPNIPNRARVKLWLLPGIFEITPEKQELLDRYVRCRRQTALYLYAPGISDGKSLDPARIRRLTGFEFGAPGVNVADLDGHRSVYIAAGPDLTVPALKDIARKTGIHLYSEYEQPVYANSRFLAVHTVKGGIQKILLPRKSAEVRELFSNRVAAKNCKEFEYEFRSPDTALFSW